MFTGSVSPKNFVVLVPALLVYTMANNGQGCRRFEQKPLCGMDGVYNIHGRMAFCHHQRLPVDEIQAPDQQSDLGAFCSVPRVGRAGPGRVKD